MAARWGAGEETLTACNMDFFPMDTLDETSVLSSGETLEALQSCLDPSILSMFEDTPTIETKGMDDESEATLLTALTEILDNVDDENLSPFDTLPDSDLLSGQKGREHSPLRRLLCLSRSPPEKDTLCSVRPLTSGKSLPRILTESLQRSDGEEEEDGSLSLSPLSQDSSLDNGLLDWEGLTLPFPVSHEQEGEDGVSVSLGDLVRHMHSYCMSISVENDDGEQMLPEGGILLEVVDQGENGEPILAIPNMNFPLPLLHEEQSAGSEHKVSDDADEVASDTSEHIVVDDDDDDESVSEAPVKVAAPVAPCQSLDVKDETFAERPKEDIKEKSPSRRKKKKKCKEQSRPEPAEGRVLRSGRVQTTAQVSPKKPEKGSVKEEKKPKVPKITIISAPAPSTTKPKKSNPCQSETQTITTEQLPVRNMQISTPVSAKEETAPVNVHSEKSQLSSSPAAVIPQQPDESPQQLNPGKLEDSSAALSTVQPPVFSESPAAAPSPVTPPVIEAPAAQEPKPKSLSLAEYRRLRQQKKPVPVEKQDDNSTKWPSLPELPKELPPIPCLPDPSPREPRRPNPQSGKNELQEVRPAWQPRGPCAPPTPEALLAPPAYMVTSSSKFSATAPVHRPRQKPEPSHPQKPSAPSPESVTNVPSHPPPCVPQSPRSPASSAPTTHIDGKSPPILAAGKDERPKPEPPKSVEVTKSSPKTTTMPVKPIAAPIVAQAPKVTGPVLLNNTVASNIKTSESTATGTQLGSSPAPHPSDPKTLKTKPVLLETKGKATAAKSPTQELIESFTTEIGIEAADLTSLLEQFEETQAKVEHCVPEVSGRAAAVGNSSVEVAPEKTIVERVRAHDLSSTAALTPPATPPHQMWKPLAPVALLGRNKAAEASKSSPSKVIQIEARPLSTVKSRSKPTPAAAATVAPEVACMDHDYCLPNKGTLAGEEGKRWNVKQQSFITIKPIKQSAASTTHRPAAPSASPALSANAEITTKTKEDPLDHRTDGMKESSILETPDASPARQDTDTPVKEESPRRGPLARSCRRPAASRTPSPRERSGGRSRKRRTPRSASPMSSGSESDSHSSRSQSRSHSPYRKRYRHHHRQSESSSSSSSRSSSRSSPSVSRSPPRRRRYSYSSSRSGSWSRSRSRSKSPQRSTYWGRGRRLNSPPQRHGYGARKDMEEVKRSKEKAIEERRVVYVGRIRGTMTQKELHERFSYFGDIEECTLHFRDHGDNYGFVTYYNTNDAFKAIENGSKLRKSDELPFDLCFGGRRQFCKSSYADLDSSREYDPLPGKGKFQALDFDTLLKQAQQKLKR